MKTLLCTCAACSALSVTLFCLAPPQRGAAEALNTKPETAYVLSETESLNRVRVDIQARYDSTSTTSTTTTTLLKQIPVKPGRPTPPQDALSYEPGSMAELIATAFPANPDLWVRIARCESGLNPNAYNAEGASGLFQIMMPLHADMLLSGESVYDPQVNIRIALSLSRNGVKTGDWDASKACWN